MDVNNVLLDTRSAIIISLTDCKPEVTERISLRRGIKDENSRKKTYVKKFDKKQLKKRVTFYLHRE